MGQGGGSGGSTGSQGGSGSGSSGSGGSGSSGGSSSGGGASNSNNQNTGESGDIATDATSAYTATSLGIVGDSSNLILHISRPSRDLSYSAVSGAAAIGSRTSDLQSVSYFLAMPGGGGLQGAVGDLYDSPSDHKDIRGLARLEGDRMTIDFADTSSNVDALAQQAELIAPEVISLQFRYFDGSSWFESWDSSATGRLPMAIEVTIGFETPETRASIREKGSSSSPQVGRSVRHVIAVPMATPAMES